MHSPKQEESPVLCKHPMLGQPPFLGLELVTS